MTQQLTLRSPAKINLFLRVLRRRPDGYHELASLFQAISLYDELCFEIADRDQITCNWPHLPIDRSNLVLKATELFRRKSGIPLSVTVRLLKQIPCEAGLGGGSSNAATTLWAMNTLAGNRFDLATLTEWAGEIGSDVAFFFSQGSAYCTGRGEKIEPVELPHRQQVWIVKPAIGLSTPKVYGALKVHELEKRDPRQTLVSHLKGRPDYYNDLEEPAFQLTPALKQLQSDLKRAGFEQVLMSGSGTSFFCLGEGVPPSFPGVVTYPSTFIARHSHQWY